MTSSKYTYFICTTLREKLTFSHLITSYIRMLVDRRRRGNTVSSTLGWHRFDNMDAKTADLKHLNKTAAYSLPLRSDLQIEASAGCFHLHKNLITILHFDIC